MLRDWLKYQGRIYLSEDLQDAQNKIERLNHGLKQAETRTKKKKKKSTFFNGVVIAAQCTATFLRSIVLPEFRY